MDGGAGFASGGDEQELDGVGQGLPGGEEHEAAIGKKGVVQGGEGVVLRAHVTAQMRLDQGGFARKEVSMAKVVVADALHQAADVAIQLNGARGYSKDTPLGWIYRYARMARLADGASEVHKMVLSRFLLAEAEDFWSWN